MTQQHKMFINIKDERIKRLTLEALEQLDEFDANRRKATFSVKDCIRGIILIDLKSHKNYLKDSLKRANIELEKGKNKSNLLRLQNNINKELECLKAIAYTFQRQPSQGLDKNKKIPPQWDILLINDALKGFSDSKIRKVVAHELCHVYLGIVTRYKHIHDDDFDHYLFLQFLRRKWLKIR